MKKKLSILLSLTMFLFQVNAFVYADNATYGDNLSDYEYSKAVIAEIMEINKILEPCDLTYEDLRSLPQKDAAFYEGLKQYLIEQSSQATTNGMAMFGEGEATDWDAVFDTSNGGPVSAESQNDADMWGYAWEMAELNKSRDPNAQDIYNETKYMYMSHYIDIKTGPRYYVDPSISNDSYFSAWITNDDRNAYNTYLDGTNCSGVLLATSNTIVDLINAGNVLKNSQSLLKIKELRVVLENLLKTTEMVTAANGIKDNYNTFVQILNEEDNPEDFVNHLKQTISLEGYDSLMTESLVSSFCAIAIASGGGSLAIPLVLGVYSFSSYVVKDFFDQVWWISLINSNGPRIAKRAMRYYGAWF